MDVRKRFGARFAQGGVPHIPLQRRSTAASFWYCGQFVAFQPLLGLVCGLLLANQNLHGQETWLPDRAESAALSAELQQLDSVYPAQRDWAWHQLRQRGLQAFESLWEAQKIAAPDPRARMESLLLDLEGAWIRQFKNPDVRILLNRLPDFPSAEQRIRLRLAAARLAPADVPELIWICRFDLDDSLARLAIECLLDRMSQLDSAESHALRGPILERCGSSQRTPIRLIRCLLQTPRIESDSLAACVQAELEQLNSDDRLAADASWDLLLAIDRFVRSSRSTDTGQERHLQQLILACPAERLTQLIEHVLVYGDRPDQMALDARLERECSDLGPREWLGRAELALSLGEVSRSQEFLARAIESVQASPTALLELGVLAQQSGSEALATALFQNVLQLDSAAPEQKRQARMFLAELLNRGQSFQEAADCLAVLFLNPTESSSAGGEGENSDRRTALQSGANSRSRAKSARASGPTSAQLRGRWAFFNAEAARQAGDSPAQCAWICQGLLSDPQSSDLLIAGLRAGPPDSDLRRLVNRLTDRRCQELLDRIRGLEQRTQSTPRNDEAYRWNQLLATELNRLAWLMACTRRSPRQAIELATQALSIDPENVHYLDTLARCQFAAGNVGLARKYARSALRLSPRSAYLQTNLQLYQSLENPGLLASRDALHLEIR